MIVTIDGPAGSGKSTVAKLVAAKLGVPHLDSGAYYRMATLACLNAGTDLDDPDAVMAEVSRNTYTRQEGRSYLNGSDVEAVIRSQRVTLVVYKIAQNQAVRAWLLTPMRAELAAAGGVIDGRDGATVIAPHADVKIWLTADVHERACRRAKEMGECDRIDWYEQDLIRRDHADAQQMTRHAHAIVIDTTAMPIDAVVEEIVQRTSTPS
ncbi:(d)CMP kinase [Stomatohabitans albus]|uniref:(d)CMP kinase n=1 Tax=Stomatohabitans albus TaxID=3110766 RepID=UPI00300D4EFC